MKPSIGRIVTYRTYLAVRGGTPHDMTAVITATQESLSDALTETGHLRELSGPDHVHLTVFSALTSHEEGVVKARDVRQAPEGEEPPGNSWRWPERVPSEPVAVKGEALPLTDKQVEQLARAVSHRIADRAQRA